MFGKRTVRFTPEDWKRLEAAAAKSGYASVDEMIRHVLEREIRRALGPDPKDDDEVKRRLEGLGYLG